VVLIRLRRDRAAAEAIDLANAELKANEIQERLDRMAERFLFERSIDIKVVGSIE
jgi:hypothetical protein